MRISNLSILGLAAISIASAASIPTTAPIEVGQIINGQNVGLTSAYILNGCMGASCINTSGQTINTAVTFSEGGYDSSLYNGATLTSPAPFTGYTAAGPTPAGSTITDPNAGGPTFAMITDTTATNNYWDAQGPSTITIPVGVFGVQQIWTMLNDKWGAVGPDTTVTFDFGSSSNVVSQSVAVALTGGQQIRDAVDCTGGNTTNCSGYVKTLATGANTINGVAVTAENVFTGAYNYTTGTHGKYNGSTGNLVLDDQLFDFTNYVFGAGALSGNAACAEYLVDIRVTEASGASNTNQTALSAVTLEVATPEPSTFALIGTGIGLLGFIRRRRKS